MAFHPPRSFRTSTLTPRKAKAKLSGTAVDRQVPYCLTSIHSFGFNLSSIVYL